MITPLERFFMSGLLLLMLVFSAYAMTDRIHSQLKDCEIGSIVDKQFTGRDNDIPTLYVRVKETIETETTDNETYFGVEIGGDINYCTYVDSFFPAMTNFTTVERIER